MADSITNGETRRRRSKIGIDTLRTATGTSTGAWIQAGLRGESGREPVGSRVGPPVGSWVGRQAGAWAGPRVGGARAHARAGLRKGEHAGFRLRQAGFTLIELLVVMAIIATLTAFVAPGYLKQSDRARETVLHHNLNTLRDSIDDFKADHGRYPDSLQKLVDDRYLREVPLDPITKKRDSWVTASGDDGGVADVSSGAAGRAIDGSRYETW